MLFMNKVEAALVDSAKLELGGAWFVPNGVPELKLRTSRTLVLDHPASLEIFGDDSSTAVVVRAPGCRVLASHRSEVTVYNLSGGPLTVEGYNRAKLKVVSVRGALMLHATHGSRFEVYSLQADVAGRVDRIAAVRIYHIAGKVSMTRLEEGFFTVEEEQPTSSNDSHNTEAGSSRPSQGGE